jgi:DNA-binding NarL/FixJ family response regulator
MQGTSGLGFNRVGLYSTEPIRLMGLISAFDGHPWIRIDIGDLDALLADSTLQALIVDTNYYSNWQETQQKVRRIRPDARLIILGPAGGDEMMVRAIAAGGRAYLDSNSGPLAVRQAVESVIRGCIWAPRRVMTKVIDQLLSQSGPIVPAQAPSFSPRERQVLDLIMTACSNREIASELGIEERTVKAYVASLMRKTGADNRVSLSVQATQNMMREQRVTPS